MKSSTTRIKQKSGQRVRTLESCKTDVMVYFVGKVLRAAALRNNRVYVPYLSFVMKLDDKTRKCVTLRWQLLLKTTSVIRKIRPIFKK